MANAISSLTLKILGDSTGLKKVYDSVIKDSQKFGKEIEKNGTSLQAVGKVMLAVGGTITASMTGTVLAVAHAAREIEHSAAVAGTTAEEYQRLAAAGKKVDVSGEEIVGGLDKLAKSMNMAAYGTGTQAKAFVALGVNVQTADGHLRKNSDVLMDVADKFKGMTNGTEKAALAQQLFGKSGASLLPILNLGRDGINKFADSAQAMGGILSNESVEQLAGLDKKVQALGGTFGLFGKQIAADLAPYLNTLIDALMSVNKWMHSMPEPIRQMITVGIALAGAIALVGGAFIVFKAQLLSTLVTLGPWMVAAAAFGAIAVLIYNNWNYVTAFLMTVWDKVVAACKIAWAGIRLYILTEIDNVLKGLQAFTGWIPGWGDKLKGAISSVEKQMHSAVNDIHTGSIAITQNKFKEHYNWMVAHNKKKNTDLVNQDKEAANQKQLQLKEEHDKAKKAAETAAKERLNLEKEWADKLFNETHNELERLNHEEEKAKNQANLSEKAKADIAAYYTAKRLELAKEAARKRAEMEKSWDEKLITDKISALNSIASDETKSDNERIAALLRSRNIQLQALRDKHEQERKEAKAVGADTATLEKVYDREVLQLMKDTEAKKAAIKKASADKLRAVTEAANDEYIAQMKKAYEKDASNNNLSNSKRITALKNLLNMELDQLRKNYKKQQEAAKGNDAALAKIDKTYQSQKISLEQETQDRINEINTAALKERSQTMADSIVDYTEELIKGEKAIGDILKEIAIKELKELAAKQLGIYISGVLKAWANAGGNPVLAAPGIAAVTAANAAASAGIAGAISTVGALADGGLAIKPSVNLIGEGKHEEAVLPLSTAVFKKLGEGIISQLPIGQTTNDDNNNQTIINHYHIGGYIDKSGLKKLVRDINPIIDLENSRKGLKK